MGMTRQYERHSKHITRTRRWQELRLEILRRDRWQCRECGKPGRLEVHHIKRVRDFPDLAYDPANLMCLCGSCHTKVTRVECGLNPAKPINAGWQEAISQLTKEGIYNA